LLIEAYFNHLRQAIDSCPVVDSFDITYDKRGSHEGFIRGEVYFVDGSTLHLREFVDVAPRVDRLTYAYQYVDRTGTMVFRYDNTGHHRELNLPTYPHHKHAGSEARVLSSSAPELPNVLAEIEALVQLP
jgi:hypothetical protein